MAMRMEHRHNEVESVQALRRVLLAVVEGDDRYAGLHDVLKDAHGLTGNLAGHLVERFHEEKRAWFHDAS